MVRDAVRIATSLRNSYRESEKDLLHVTPTDATASFVRIRKPFDSIRFRLPSKNIPLKDSNPYGENGEQQYMDLNGTNSARINNWRPGLSRCRCNSYQNMMLDEVSLIESHRRLHDIVFRHLHPLT